VESLSSNPRNPSPSEDTPYNRALQAAIGSGVPAAAIAGYGRWWQVENYLRQLAYTVLRAAFGRAWTTHLSGASGRARRDRVNAYMASPDADELLAYADVSDLFNLIEDHWDLFEAFLPPRTRWLGTAEELLALRHRSAHCRRPHPDDLGRLEQALRDFESGARHFYSSYLRTTGVFKKNSDPVVSAWVGSEHEDAQRLIAHAQSQYEVEFRLGWSKLASAGWVTDDAISGAPGYIWHATWFLRRDELRPVDLWEDLTNAVRSSPIHIIQSSSMHVVATFAAVDDPTEVADAIGSVFDAILTRSRDFGEPADSEEWSQRWREGADSLPQIVQVGDAVLALFDEYQPDSFSLFAA
jgi:hypothetical protein